MQNDIQNILWPGWETVRLIGRGSFGAVYEIQRKVFDDIEKAALKVISIPQNSSDIDELYSDGYDEESITTAFKSHLQSIVAEYSLMRKMNGCANIVNCDDVRYVQHDDGIGWDIYIKMELLTPLTKALPTEIPEDTVVKIAKDMCGALELCKKHGIVHRDIKPQNIFVSEYGDYKLGDFGIAKTVEKTMGGTKIGTYKYMAPEVYNNQPYGSGADIYSLGLVLYWLLNERRMPFMPLPPQKLQAGIEEQSRNRRLSGEELPAPAHGSDKLKKIVLKACAYDPKDRFQSASDMLLALENAYGKTAEEHEPPLPPVPPAPPKPEPVPTPGDIPDTTKHKKVSGRTLGIIAIILVLIISFILLLHSCGGNSSNGDETTVPTATSEKQDTTESTSTTEPIQVEWSEWSDSLPSNVTADTFDIDEKVLYSSRVLETTSSTDSNTMEGWELFDTVEAGNGFGPWSDWSDTSVTSSDKREVETRTVYRYRDKETTTGSNSSKSGWELHNTTYSWGSYGAWSDWSTNSVSNSDSRKVETKTQYRYRDISYSTEYTSWSDWSDWSFDGQSTSDLKKEESRTVWAYAYFLCPHCGAHMHGWGQCWTWAGGCGAATSDGHWHEVWSTTSWDQAGLKDWYGTGKYYAYIDGQLVFKWPEGGSRTQYRYSTRSTQEVANYGNWSSWGDTAYSNSSSREVQTRTVYRFCDRSQIPTYHFYRWGSWSNWSANSISATGDRQVETAVHYRYRDQVITRTYYFRRWGEWSDYTETAVSPSENTEVQTKTQYRYKSKSS